MVWRSDVRKSQITSRVVMTELIMLDVVRDINRRIDDDIEFYQGQLDKANTRLAILKLERQQLVDLINILEGERNK